MMTELFRQATERGEPVAILWASEAAIYQRFGFGMATKGANFEAAKERSGSRTRSSRRARCASSGATSSSSWRHRSTRRGGRRSSARSAGRTPAGGSSIAHDAEWAQFGRGHKVLAVYEVDGQARGYAIHRRKADWAQTGPQHTITVFEVLGLDPEAEQALWQWLFSLDLVETVACVARPGAEPAAADDHRAAPAEHEPRRRDLPADHRPEGRARGPAVPRAGERGVRGFG